MSGRFVRPEPGRKYFNHMATWTGGYWHRHWLLSSGQYIKTSDPDMRKGYGWALVGENGPDARPGEFLASCLAADTARRAPTSVVRSRTWMSCKMRNSTDQR